MLSPPNFILLSAQDKDALIVQLLARLEALEREKGAAYAPAPLLRLAVEQGVELRQVKRPVRLIRR